MSYIDSRACATPAYVINEQALECNFETFSSAFCQYWGNTSFGYSVKTNPLPWLLNYAQDKGFLAEVVSDQEYLLAKRLGYSDGDIIFNGPIKGYELFLKCILGGGIINIDSKREIDWLSTVALREHSTKVGLRVNINLETLCPGESRTGAAGSRFGFCPSNGELAWAIQQIQKLPNVSLDGLHLHVNSMSRSVKVYRALVQFACELQKAYDLDLSYIDIGGGFFGGVPNTKAYGEYAQVIAEGLAERFSPTKTRLIVEPGGSILATPISFYAEVVDVKEIGEQRVAITQASRVWLDPTMSKDSYKYRVISTSASTIADQLICGFTCMDTDRLMHITDEPELAVGDRIIFEMVGAYTYCFNPAFFIETRPFVYIEHKDGQFELIRERDSIEFL